MITPLSSSRQLGFHLLLLGARKTVLQDALLEAVSIVNPIELKRQLSKLIPREIQQLLASANIRDELIFPAPILLKAKPTLVGYYRLLLGIPQKSFYAAGTGMGVMKKMETQGTIGPRQEAALVDFCRAMSVSLSELVSKISPKLTARDISELPLLTIGSQFQGGNNNIIGKQATQAILLIIAELVKKNLSSQERRKIKIRNKKGNVVSIIFSGDPDVCITEKTSEGEIKKVALEIKGGTDQSNAHNRAGEAEKSHQKAKKAGYAHCWTLITKKGLDMNKLHDESPTTEQWFDIAQVLAKEGEDWQKFRTSILKESLI